MPYQTAYALLREAEAALQRRGSRRFAVERLSEARAIAVLLGAAFLHERVTLHAGLGGILVLCSIFMITISFQRSRA